MWVAGLREGERVRGSCLERVVGSRRESKRMPEICQNQYHLKGRKNEKEIRKRSKTEEEKKRQRGREG